MSGGTLQPLPWLGRAQEQKRLAGLVGIGDGSVASMTRPTGAVVFGPAGVGKSRLAQEVLEQAETAGRPTAVTAPTLATQRIPFGALAFLLGDLGLGAGAAPDRVDLLGAAVERLVERVGGPDPVLLVDDAHLLDDLSAALVHQLALSGSASVLLTVRSGEAVPASIDACWQSGLIERLDLEPLGAGVIADVCAGALGGRLDSRSQLRLIEASAGNLLYLRELLIEGLESGALRSQRGLWTWTGRLRVGQRLASIMDRSLTTGGDGALADLLELVAVGEPLELDLVCRPSDGASLPVIEHAESLGLLRIEHRRRRAVIRLAHPLFGEALRARLGAMAERRICAQIAAGLAAAGGRRSFDVLRLASFELRSGEVRHPDVLIDAAIHARFLGDLPLAERCARAAVDLGMGRAAELVLADCLFWMGEHDESIELGRRIDDDGLEPEALARSRTQLASSLFFARGDTPGAMAVLRTAEQSLAGDPWRLRLVAHRAELSMFASELPQAEELARSVLDTDSPVPVAATGAAHGALVPALALGGRVDAANRAAEEALTYLFSLEQPPWMEAAGVIVGQFLAALLGGGLEEVEAVVEPLFQDAVRRPSDPFAGVWGLLLGRSATARGSLDRARDLLEEASVLLAADDPGNLRPWSLGALAQALGMRGDAARAAEVVAEMEPLPQLACYRVDMDLGRAWALAAGGEPEGARRVVGAAATAALAQGQFGCAAFAAVEGFRLGLRPAEVGRVWSRARSHVEGRLLPAAMAAANPGDRMGAAETIESLGMDLWAAELYGLAATDAVATCQRELEAASLAARTRLLPRCAGARTPLLTRPVGEGPLAMLTAREHDVVRLVASGLSNPEIGERLFVSRRTVESHLARVFAKLGVTGREQLAALVGPHA